MKRKLLIDLGFIFVALLIVIPVIIPFFNAGYFPSHDGEWAVVRLADMFRTLRDFQIPPRFSGALNFGYGYPLFNFAYPFPYFFGILFYLPFHSFITSIKAVFVVSVFLSSIFMYFASAKLWNNKIAGIVSAILYVYLPYRMVDLYVRGSIGESLAFALFPLILYLILKLFDSPFARAVVVTLSVSISILVMTHNIMTILFLPVIFSFTLIKIISERRFDVLQSFILCLLLGAGLSFFFWFPALFEKGNILLSTTPIADRSLYYVDVQQLIIPSWGYGVPTVKDAFSYQLGVAQIATILIVFVILVLSFIKTKMVQTPLKKAAYVIVGIYVICLIMMLPLSDLIWKNTPLLSEINYPWTLLSQLGFLAALVSGLMVIQGKLLKYVALVIGAIAIIQVFPYAHPQNYNYYTDDYYMTNEATTTSSSELMPLWVKNHPTKHYDSKVEVVDGEAQINDVKHNSKSVKFNYSTNSDVVFKINTIYYPGWKAYVDGIESKINYDNPEGVMTISASKFGSSVQLVFMENLARTIANAISVLAVLVILFIFLRPLLLFKS